MNMEIERKFLVKQPPGALNDLSHAVIRQGYLIATDTGLELRVRQKGPNFYQTIKMGEGLTRTEIEMSLSEGQFNELWPHTEGRRVSKTRYQVPLGDHIAELDLFDGGLAGLLLVEVEFPSEDSSREFPAPDWFGVEVTEDKRYKNKWLAANGIPKD
jgi:CYTH domain-containing protein